MKVLRLLIAVLNDLISLLKDVKGVIVVAEKVNSAISEMPEMLVLTELVSPVQTP